ncbi:1390_t:CDS:2 [Rhizophagus irregularis]|nr:1390_t:CDS:2 [Rhizophagus irregularis]
MQSDDFCDLFEERYLSDNGDNDISGTKLQINTNVAESCHANENRDGKSLSLEAVILGIKKPGKILGCSKKYVDPVSIILKAVTQTSTSSIVNDDLEKEKQKDFFEREIRTRRERAET